MEEDRLSFTSTIIGILTFVAAVFVWLNQHLHMAIMLDDELVEMTVTMMQSSRESLDYYILYDETARFRRKSFAEILGRLYSLELKSMEILLRILGRSRVRRIFTWEKQRDRLKQNLSELKGLRSTIFDILLFDISL